MTLCLQDIDHDFLTALKTAMAVMQRRRQPTCWGYLGAREYFNGKGLSLPRAIPQDKELRALHVLAEMGDQVHLSRPANSLPAFKGGMDAVIGYASKYLSRAFGASLREGPSVISPPVVKSQIRSLPGNKTLGNPTTRELMVEIQRLRQEMKSVIDRKSGRFFA